MEPIVGAAFELSELLQAPKFFFSRNLNTNDNSLILTTSGQHEKQWKPWCTNFILTSWNLPRNFQNLKNPEMTIDNFLNYLLLFLRGVPGRAIQMPVSMHRAQWMAKVIYEIKMFLFRGQLKLTTPEQMVFVTLFVCSNSPSSLDASSTFAVMVFLNDYRPTV